MRGRQRDWGSEIADWPGILRFLLPRSGLKIGNLISPITSEFTQRELLNQGDGKRQGGHGRLAASHPLSPKSRGPSKDSAPARRLDRDSRPFPTHTRTPSTQTPAGNSKRRPERVHVHERQFASLGRRLLDLRAAEGDSSPGGAARRRLPPQTAVTQNPLDHRRLAAAR